MQNCSSCGNEFTSFEMISKEKNQVSLCRQCHFDSGSKDQNNSESPEPEKVKKSESKNVEDSEPTTESQQSEKSSRKDSTLSLNKKWLVINTGIFLVLSFIFYMVIEAAGSVISNDIFESMFGGNYDLNRFASSHHIGFYGSALLLFIPGICLYFLFRVSEEAKKVEQKILLRPYIFLVLLTSIMVLGGELNGNFSYFISLSVIPILFWNIGKGQFFKRALLATGIIYLFKLFSYIVSIGLPTMVELEYTMWLYLKTPVMLVFILLFHILAGFLFVKMINPHFKQDEDYDGLRFVRDLYHISPHS